MPKVHDWLDHRARLTPNAAAFFQGERSLTYAELNQIVSDFCVRLRRLGVEPRQRVGVLMANSLEYAVLIHALVRLNAVLAPLNLRLNHNKLLEQFRHVGCQFLICDDTTESDELKRHGVRVSSISRLKSTEPGGQVQYRSNELELDDVATLVFTSGSSGTPKAVRLTLSNHLWSATASAFRLGHRADDRFLLCMPLYHVGGLAQVFRACLYGNALVVLPRFKAQTVAQAVEAHRVTMVSLVPTMLHRLLPLWRKRFPASLRCVLMGGAAMPQSLLSDALALGLPIATTYGLTEAASQVATQSPGFVKHKPGSVGRALRWSELKVVDEAGKALPNGHIGVILVRGPTVMQRYERHPAATGEAMQNGWLRTGDLGYLDQDGDLWVVDRRSDVIVSGGENIYPSEIEAVLRGHPGVADVCVVGVPDDEWGQRVAALVVVRDRADQSADALEQFCEDRLPGYQRPRYIKFSNDLPRNATGKVDRAEVQRMLASA